MPDLVIVDGGKRPGERGEGRPRRAGPPRPAAGRSGQGARGAVPPGPHRPDPPAGDVAGALPRPAPARRGAPVRDHVSPRPARDSGASGRRSTTCPGSGRSASRELLKVFGSIKRVRDAPVEQIAAVPGHRTVAGGPDQGDAGGLTRATIAGDRSEFFIVPATASLSPSRMVVGIRPRSGRAAQDPARHAAHRPNPSIASTGRRRSSWSASVASRRSV